MMYHTTGRYNTELHLSMVAPIWMFDTFHWPLTALSIPNKQLINYDRRTKIMMRFIKHL